MASSRISSSPERSKAIVLSIKQKYAELILSGSKTVEFRRCWAAGDVETIAIYACSPVQRFVGLASVSQVVRAEPSVLWEYCSRRGGGMSKTELHEYFIGKEVGFAVLLKDVSSFSGEIDPHQIVKGFSPPQSFRYLSASELRKLKRKLSPEKVGR
jgi:predicted transcriptional regulator